MTSNSAAIFRYFNSRILLIFLQQIKLRKLKTSYQNFKLVKVEKLFAYSQLVDFVLEGECQQGVCPNDGADGVVPCLLPVEGNAAKQRGGRRHAVRRCKIKVGQK